MSAPGGGRGDDGFEIITFPADLGPNTDRWADDREQAMGLVWTIPPCIEPPGDCPAPQTFPDRAGRVLVNVDDQVMVILGWGACPQALSPGASAGSARHELTTYR